MKITDKMRLIMETNIKLKVVILLIIFVCCFLFFLLLTQLWGYLLLTRDLEASWAELAHVKSVVAAEGKEQEKLLEANKNLSELENYFQLEMRDGTPLVLLGQLSGAIGVEVISLTPAETIEHSQVIEIPLVLVARGDYLDILSLCQEMEDNALHNFTLIRYVKVTAYSNPGIAARERNAGFPANARAFQASNMVEAELGISIFTSATPENKSHFDWEKGSQPSIFYNPAPELSTKPGFSTTPEPSTTEEEFRS
jgi:hypothetical protein